MDRIKELETERENLMSAMGKKDALIAKIQKWLTEEVNSKWLMHEPTWDDLCEGRHECAKGLLDQIEKWENE